MKEISLLGNVYGNLTVIKRLSNNTNNHKVYKCICKCGNESIVSANNLRTNSVKSCGCLRKEKAFNTMIGKRFTKLVIINFYGKSKNKLNNWLCKCDCGNTIILKTNCLNRGNTKSCGCLRKANVIYKTRAYSSYKSMKARCNNKNHDAYKNYGGRGITVCDRWLESFDNFLEDMGERPIDKSLDRIDNNGNYEPINCRWATIKEQNNNKRKKQKS